MSSGEAAPEPRPKYKLGVSDLYESRDKRGTWWRVTLLAYNEDGTYQAQVHDWKKRVWPVVLEKNIQLLGPHTPSQEPDVVWDRDKGVLILSANTPHKIRLERHGDGVGITIPSHHQDVMYVFKRVMRHFPENSRSYVHLTSSKPNTSFKLLMPAPQYAIYPLMRMLFDDSGVEHNLGDQPPDKIDEWEKHVSKTGLLYWYNTETKVNQWKEPTEDNPHALEKQLQLAIKQSLAQGLPRDKAETDAEKQRLFERLEERGFEQVTVADDGHCQFRSVSYCVKKDDNQHMQVRQEVVEHILKNREVYSNFVDADLDEYCREMSGSRWGDHITLVAAANLYNTRIEIIASNKLSSKVLMPRDAEGTISEPKYDLVVAYLAEPDAQHYNPCRKKRPVSPSGIPESR